MATPTIYTPKRLMIPQLLTASDQRYYASPLGLAGTQVKSIILTNTTSSTTTATVYLTESGASPATYNKLINAAPIPTSGDPLVFEFDGLYMNAGDEIYAKASVTSRIVLQISGVELA